MGGDVFDVMSAGVLPTNVRPEAIAVMSELGIDISGHRSKSVDEFREQSFDYVITVCENARQRLGGSLSSADALPDGRATAPESQCPIFPGQAVRIHWGLDDPAEVKGDDDTRLIAFRAARDELSARLRDFSSKNG